VTIFALLVAGCSGWEPMDYHPNSEIPEGPGMISGKKGGWTIFRIEDEPVEEKEPNKEEEEDKDSADAN